MRKKKVAAGRPPETGTPRKMMIKFRVDPDEADDIEEMAVAAGLNISQLIRMFAFSGKPRPGDRHTFEAFDLERLLPDEITSKLEGLADDDDEIEVERGEKVWSLSVNGVEVSGVTLLDGHVWDLLEFVGSTFDSQ